MIDVADYVRMVNDGELCPGVGQTYLDAYIEHKKKEEEKMDKQVEKIFDEGTVIEE